MLKRCRKWRQTQTWKAHWPQSGWITVLLEINLTLSVPLEVCYYIKGLIFVSSADMWGHSGKESACQSRRHKRCGFPAEGNGNSLHYFCLEMFMDREAIVQGVSKRWTQLTHTYTHTDIWYSSGTTLDSLYESESLPLCWCLAFDSFTVTCECQQHFWAFWCILGTEYSIFLLHPHNQASYLCNLMHIFPTIC